MTKLILSISCLLIPFLAFAQSITGKVISEATQTPLEGVLINAKLDNKSVVTDSKGIFTLELQQEQEIEISSNGFEALTISYNGQSDLGTIQLKALEDKDDAIPTISLNDVDVSEDDASLSDNISGLLTASRDPFLSEAAFALGQYRFRVRGLDSEHGTLILNGIPMGELENGRIYWNTWGGLNDVFRNRDIKVGLSPAETAFGGPNGTTTIDTRAATQRAQTRLSYAISNRSYRNRIMLTHSTGMSKKGWALSLSASRRWANEGYVAGTVYDAYSYFVSIDKKINDAHSLSLTALGAPSKRGRIGIATQEARDIAGTNYYNPLWGYQNGEKRNSRIQSTHQPIGILRHDWTINENSNLTTAISYQTGTNAQTRLDWFNRADPRPTYYRYLPSYLDFGEDATAEEVAARRTYLQNNPELMQINWDNFYDENSNYVTSVENANGITGNTVTGAWSRTILEEQHFDNDKLNFSTNYRNALSDKVTLYLGARYQSQTQHTYRLVKDLLGGDFTVNIDKFAERESVDDIESFQQYDLNEPNKILTVGDKYGWNYDLNIRKPSGWAQIRYEGKRIDVFAAGEFEATTIWREGFFKNGRFPDNSEGESEKLNYKNFGAKGGLTYKVNGRNYIYANASYQTKAPYARYAFTSPRTRNQITPNLTSEKILSAEGGYNLRAPKLKGRLTAYYNRFEDQTNRIPLYFDYLRTFGTMILQDIDRTHTGIEAALTYDVGAGFSLTGVAGLGKNIYTSRQNANIYLDVSDDNNEIFANNSFKVYSKNFYVANGPQEAYTFKVSYQGKKYWFANLNFNYFDKIFTSFSPVRRTETAVFNLDPNSETFDNIIAQEQLPAQYTLDFFGGKSFKFKDLFLYLNVGVSNILDNQDFRTGGFEQTRFNYVTKDPNNFPPYYFYSFGRTYFISATLKL